jgi:protein gp37
MPTRTKIEWIDYVTNPIRAFVIKDNLVKDGFACVRKSEGCKHCWASSMNVRLGTGLEYTLPNLAKVSIYLKQKELNAIRTFKAKGPFKNGRSRAMVFPCDMTDLFGEWMDDNDIKIVFNTLAYRMDVDFMVLTKRPEEAAMWLDHWLSIYQNVPQNIFIGTSIENDARARERLGPMKAIHEMGFKTAVSYEPALELVNWTGWDFLKLLIAGGESGNGARPMPLYGARFARDFCSMRIPFFFKQWGEWAPVADLLARGCTTFKNKPIEVMGEMMVKVGKGLAGHLLDGVEWRQMP